MPSGRTFQRFTGSKQFLDDDSRIVVIFAAHFNDVTRAVSSAGSEHLPYKQRVGGSNPSLPTPSKRGGTGRRTGLKIQRAQPPCGFDSRRLHVEQRPRGYWPRGRCCLNSAAKKTTVIKGAMTAAKGIGRAGCMSGRQGAHLTLFIEAKTSASSKEFPAFTEKQRSQSANRHFSHCNSS